MRCALPRTPEWLESALLMSSPDEDDPYQASTTGRGGMNVMAWIFLFLAGLLEVAWSLGLKYTEGLTRFWPSILTILAIIASMGFLAQATRTLPVGTAYAIWVGVGIVGATLGGAWLFDEPMPPARIFFLGLLLVAILGLKMTASP